MKLFKDQRFCSALCGNYRCQQNRRHILPGGRWFGEVGQGHVLIEYSNLKPGCDEFKEPGADYTESMAMLEEIVKEKRS